MSPVNSLKPFSPPDHVCPKLIVEEEVWIHVPPPPVVNDGFIVWFPCLHDPVKGILGNLHFCQSSEGNYLVSQQVVTKPQQQSVFPPIPTMDSLKEPTGGQLNYGTTTVFTKDQSMDNGLLEDSSHW